MTLGFLFILVCDFASSTSISQAHKKKEYDCLDLVPRSRICVADAKELLSEANALKISPSNIHNTHKVCKVSLFENFNLCFAFYLNVLKEDIH